MLGLPAGSEWLIILLVIVLLFGVGRLSRIGGELGKGIREFRRGIKGEEEKSPAGDQPDDASKPDSGSA
jgi:sec-independent protein translocase protein TatA